MKERIVGGEPPHGLQRTTLDTELASARELVAVMGERVEDAISRSVDSLTGRDPTAAASVIADDGRINEMHGQVQELCLTVIVTQQPVARDLRTVISLMAMASELERMGDHGSGIAKIAQRFSDLPELPVPDDLLTLAGLCREQLRDILDAVARRDVAAARAVAARDEGVDAVYRRLCDELADLMASRGETVRAATQLIFAAHCLERVADRVTNLAEKLVFLETGKVEELG